MHIRNYSRGESSGALYIEQSIELLKKSGNRVTKPRLAVLECLANSEQCLSPKDILAKINEDNDESEVDLATVYRILQAFSELRLVHRIGSEGAFMACAHLRCASEMHIIAYCTSCDKYQEIDLPHPFIATLKRHVKDSMAFKLADHFFQMIGTCAECNLKTRGRSANTKDSREI
jgi:Fe2+ or Zn2+ uptake regulation protein